MLVAVPSARRLDLLLLLWSDWWGDCSALLSPCKTVKGKKATLRLGMCSANAKLLEAHKER